MGVYSYLMAIELRQLRYFVGVSEAGSISRGARAMHITQPALTIALHNLERDVGVALLERHSRGVDLTPAGSVFLAQAELALEHVDEATRGARRRVAAESGGEVSVGLLPATFSEVSCALLSAFRTQHPAVRIKYRELSYIGHTRDLLSGRADVAFLWPPYNESALRFHALSQEPRLLGVAETHPLAGRDAVSLDEILDLPFPGFHPASSGGWFSRWFFDEVRGALATTTRDETATPLEMALVVQEGRAVAPAAQTFAQAFPAKGVRWLDMTDAPPATLALAWHPRSPNPATHALVRIARALTEAPSPTAALIAAHDQPTAHRA